MMNRLFTSLTLAVVLFSAMAGATGPVGGAVQGTLSNPDGTALTDNNVSFRIQVLDKNATCVLYEERHTGVNLSLTNGDFSLQLGTGSSRANNVDGTTALSANVYRNDVNLPAFTGCPGGLTFAEGDERLLRVTFNVGSGDVVLTPDVRVQSSAYAVIAESVNGRTAADLVQIRNDGTHVLTQANVENVFSNTNYAALTALLNGTSTAYLPTNPSAAVNFNGQRLTNLGAPTATNDAVTRGYADGYIGGRQADTTGVSTTDGNGYVMVWDQGANRWVAGEVDAVRLRGRTIANVAPADGQILKFNSTTNLWEPRADNQGITALTGDVVASGSGTVTATIQPNAVTSAKISNSGIAINRLLITNPTDGITIVYKDDCNINWFRHRASGLWTGCIRNHTS